MDHCGEPILIIPDVEKREEHVKTGLRSPPFQACQGEGLSLWHRVHSESLLESKTMECQLAGSQVTERRIYSQTPFWGAFTGWCTRGWMFWVCASKFNLEARRGLQSYFLPHPTPVSLFYPCFLGTKKSSGWGYGAELSVCLNYPTNTPSKLPMPSSVCRTFLSIFPLYC